MAADLCVSDRKYKSDFLCTSCDETNEKADIFCRNCSKYFCLGCSAKHDELFRKHLKLDRTEVEKWGPPADDLGLCEKHRDKPVILLCTEHSALCCHDCVTMDHRYMHFDCSSLCLLKGILYYYIHLVKLENDNI